MPILRTYCITLLAFCDGLLRFLDIPTSSPNPLYNDRSRMTSTTPNSTLLDTLKSPRSATSPIYSPSIRSTRLSEDSDDSLRDLELSEGPLLAENTRPFRGRSYSVSGFDFQRDLLPLSASVSEPEDVHLESNEKRLGLVNGAWSCSSEAVWNAT